MLDFDSMMAETIEREEAEKRGDKKALCRARMIDAFRILYVLLFFGVLIALFKFGHPVPATEGTGFPFL